MNILNQLRASTKPLTPEEYMAIHSNRWIQYFDDTPAKDVSKALSTAQFNIEEMKRKQSQHCGAFASLHAFDGARKEVNVKKLLALGLDIDLVKPDEKTTITEDGIDQRKNATLNDLQKLSINFHLVAETQHGLHLELWINPLDPTVETVRQWKEAEETLGKLLNADKNAMLVTQVLRIHGTQQFKNPRKPFCVRTLINNTDKLLHNFDEVRTALSVFEVFDHAQHTPKNQSEAPSSPKIINPSGIAEGSRNTTLTSLAGSLHHRCIDNDTVLEVLKAVNKKRCIPPLPESEIHTIINSISKYPVSTGQYGNTPVLVRLADVMPESVKWLWANRIPRGKITMLEGDPGNGKSWCSLAITCAVTRGHTLPGDSEAMTPANVLLLTAEDGTADTIRPRLEGMEADLSKVKILTGIRNAKGEEHHPSLVDDIPALEKALDEGGYALLVIDPLNAYLPKIDTNNDAALRTVFNPLARLAEKYHVAILCIRHLTKSARDKAIYRGQGSIAYTAAARVVHLVGINPSNQHERIIICIKNNLAPLPKGRAFKVAEGRFLWGNETDISADLLLGSDSSASGGGALEEAQNFLRVTLFEEAKPVSEIEDESEGAGISKSTLKRARIAMGIKPRREGGKNGFWVWELPQSSKEIKKTNDEPWSPLKSEQDDLKLPISPDT